MKLNSPKSKVFAIAMLALLIYSTFAACKARIDAFLLDSTYTLTKESDGRITIEDIDSPRWKQIACDIFSSSVRERIKRDLAKKEFTSQSDFNQLFVSQYADDDKLIFYVKKKYGRHIQPGCGSPPNYVWKNGQLKSYWDSFTLAGP
ncbi:MAG: hypothetical protein KF836_11070 [Fimbriimonadaceae bacterium]|nr:hypothetical protein [Fimbriimonadaceae bacterium]